MPMRIVNLKGGGGPAPSGGASDSGLYRFIVDDNIINTEPSSSIFTEIWKDGDINFPKPESITVMFWGNSTWIKPGDIGNINLPPDCGSAFGIVTLKGDDIPKKLYTFCGRHQVVYPYTYPEDRTCGFSATPSRTDGFLLPNMGGRHMFQQTDFKAADAINHNFGEWESVFNGGDGHWWSRTTSDDRDSPGSHGSMFGNGYTSTGEYPSSCGGPGTSTGRGPAAAGVDDAYMKPLGSLRQFAKEDVPGSTDTNLKGGNGGFFFILPTGTFGLARGAPFLVSSDYVSVPGPQRPRDRLDTNREVSAYMCVLIEFKK